MPGCRPFRSSWRSYPTSAPALAVSEGVDRDRGVDEAGHQTGVFGRVGSRPLNHEEMRRMLTLGAGEHAGEPFAVPRLAERSSDPSPAERALRAAEVGEAFGRAPFRRLEASEDVPAVEWPEKTKKKKKR